MNDRRTKTGMTPPREDVVAAALHAMYVDVCGGCRQAGVTPPSPQEWADLLADHLAEVTRESQAPPSAESRDS